MKKIMSLILAVVLLFSFTAQVSFASDYSEHWAKDVISKWIEAGKISGYTDGTFRPNNNITRAEFVSILANVFPYDPVEYKDVRVFKDVSEKHWFVESVRKLLSLEIIAEDEYFNPQRELTREEAITMIGRAFGYQSSDLSSLEVFSDFADISDFAVEYAAALKEAEIVAGFSDGTIRPKAKITRAECIKLLDGFNLVKEKYSLEGIMERIYGGVDVEYPMIGNFEITSENSEFYLGIPNMEFEEAIASEALMGSQAHSVCLVRVKEGSDIEAIKEEIRTKVDPRKWICVGVEREDVIVVNQENLILLIIDQFAPEALRDSFLSLDVKKKPLIEANADGLIYTDGYYMDDIGLLRENGVNTFSTKIEWLSNKYAENNDVYFSVIPSKSYFVNDNLKNPFDYNKMFDILKSVKSAKYIDITGELFLTDYYITDPHWKQENLQKVIDAFGKEMGFSVDLKSYTENKINSFIGQHGYNKDNFISEELIYLSNNHIDGAKVAHIEGSVFNKVYELEKLNSASPYDMFLSGPSAITTITNENASSDKSVVIFGDSYSRNFAPLLIENYKEITLVDLRYVISTMLDNFVSFENKDILFLYNDQIINNGEMLKVIMK